MGTPGNIFSSFSGGIDNLAMPPSSGILSHTGDVTFDDPSPYSGYPAVVFIDGDLKITNRVRIDSDTGLVFIVSGKIEVDGGVTEIDGFYIANGIFDSGNSSNQLVVSGSILAFGGVDVKDKRVTVEV